MNDEPLVGVSCSGRDATASVTTWALAALLLASLCGPACVDLPRESSPITYWTLAPVSLEVEAPAGGAERTLVVGPLNLPAYLDRLEILHRAGSHQLIVKRFDHWAGPLTEQIPRVLAQDISSLAPSILAAPYPGLPGGRPDLQLYVTLLAFEVDAYGVLQLHASWSLVDLDTGSMLGRASTQLSEPAGDRSVEQMVAAMSRALAGLARLVVQDLP